MAAAPSQDPIRATLIAILQQLNQAEANHEGQAAEQALELAELERRLADFWAVQNGSVKISLAVGLLLRNGLVQASSNAEYSWERQRDVAQRYQITVEGKQFLISSIESSDRIR
jgi:hypothetical protein